MSQRLPSAKPKGVLRALGRAGSIFHHTSGSQYGYTLGFKATMRIAPFTVRSASDVPPCPKTP